MTGTDDHDLWLSPIIVVPKKDGSPRRVEDFSKLNKLCKRSKAVTMDIRGMAVSVPTAEEGGGDTVLFT